MGIYTEHEMKLLKEASVYIENKDEYSKEEKQYTVNQVIGFIMNHSSKDNIISNVRNEYDSILEKNRT